MNLPRRVFDDVSQLVGSRENPTPGTLTIRLEEEALKNVISSLKTEGHRVTNVSREEGIFLLEVTKGV